MSNTTRELLQANLQKTIEELESAEAHNAVVTNLGKKRKVGGGVVARKAASKRVAEAHAALALAQEQLQEAKEQNTSVSVSNQIETRSAAMAQTPDTRGVHVDPKTPLARGGSQPPHGGSEEIHTESNVENANLSIPVNAQSPDSPQAQHPTPDVMAPKIMPDIYGIEPPLTAVANAIPDPGNHVLDGRVPTALPTAGGSEAGFPDSMDIDGEAKFEGPGDSQDTGARVEDGYVGVGLKSERRLSETKSAEEIALLATIKDMETKPEPSSNKASQKKKKNAKDNSEIAITPWDELNDVAKDEIRAEGKAAIATYIKSNGKKKLPSGLRRQIREVQELLPEAATTSFALALSIFYTISSKNRNHYQRDGFEGEYLVKGPAYEKDYDADPQPGHMHCGCSINVVLMEFYFWKTWTITSTHLDKKKRYKESMRDEVVPARLRGFFVQAYMEATCLTLGDLYELGGETETTEYKKRLRERQMEKISQEYNRLGGNESEEVWALIPRDSTRMQMGA
ncbi:hypothetical protein BD779DRAFT_1479300 [Infundibulicybe gibba]|nr:hypothetical protein BD779DRAFT_1479300 [Infundibulicybe gibba]